MKVYCVLREESRPDLDHVIFAHFDRKEAEKFAIEWGKLDETGKPKIEVLDVEEILNQDEV